METYQPHMAPQFRQLLRLRAVQLRERLSSDHPALAGTDGGGGHEVEDFKDAATQEAHDLVTQAQSGQAARELLQVSQALERVEEGSYGVCQECCEPIDLRRLLALPAVSLCAGCQQRCEDSQAHRAA
jgi:RNA polymerase-binding transcription factor DksA